MTALSVVCCAIALGVGLASYAGRDAGVAARSSPQAAVAPGKLLPSSPSIELGFVARGGRAEEFFTLTNTSKDPVVVTKVTTSCPCLAVGLTRRVVEPSQTVVASAVLDLAPEPDFVGGLSVKVEGVSPSGEPAFSLVVGASVRGPDEFRFGKE